MRPFFVAAHGEELFPYKMNTLCGNIYELSYINKIKLFLELIFYFKILQKF